MKKLILIVLLLSGLNCLSQNNSHRFYSFNVNDGLSQGNVTCMLQDHLGLMWFGTWDGLNLYDGNKNKIYRYSSNDTNSIRGSLINAIFETKANELYVATSQSLNCFDRLRNKFTKYNINSNSNDFRILNETNGFLMLSINNQLWKFNLITKEFHRCSNSITSNWNLFFKNSKTAVNHSDMLYPHLFELLKLNIIDQSKFQQFYQQHTINDIIITNEHDYFATDNGLWKFNKITKDFSNIIEIDKIKCLLLHNQQLYIGSQTSGLRVLDLQNDKIIQEFKPDFNSKYTISGEFVRTMYLAKDNVLWTSVLGNGISYTHLIANDASTLLSKNDAMLISKSDHYIKTIIEDNDNVLWVSSIKGNTYLFDNKYHLLKTITPNQIDPIDKPNSFQQQYISAKGQQFLLTENGLYSTIEKYKFKKILNQNLNPNQLYLTCINPLNDTTFLIGSRDGLNIFHNGKNPTIQDFTQIQYHKVILNVYTDKLKRIYVNPMFGGLDIYELNENHYEKIKSIDLGFNVKQFVEINDTLWIATTMGIIKLNLHNLIYQIFDETNKIPNQYIYCLLQDNNDASDFWCSSNRGIFKYNPTTKRVVSLNLDNGLSSLEFNTNAFAKRKNGDFVFGSIDGIAIINPNKLRLDNNLKPCILNNFIVDNIDNYSFYNNDLKSYEIPYRNNNFTAQLSRINYPASASSIRYRLFGYDESILEVDNYSEIRYSKLPIGNYIIQIEIETATGVTQWLNLASIHIIAPWYLTIWSFLLYAVSIIVILYVLVKWYLKNKLKEKSEEQSRKNLLIAERDRISADLHDDIGSTLSSVSIYSELIQSNFEKKTETVQALSKKISTSIKDLMMRTDDIIWSLKIGRHQNETFEKRIKEYAIDLLEAKNIKAEIHIEHSIEDFIIHPDHRRHLLMLVKEAMNNCSKYSNATQFNVHFSISNKLLTISIKDNGNGFDMNLIKFGDGLGNMKSRCESLKGNFKITSKINQGTQINCNIPIAIFSYDTRENKN